MVAVNIYAFYTFPDVLVQEASQLLKQIYDTKVLSCIIKAVLTYLNDQQ